MDSKKQTQLAYAFGMTGLGAATIGGLAIYSSQRQLSSTSNTSRVLPGTIRHDVVEFNQKIGRRWFGVGLLGIAGAAMLHPKVRKAMTGAAPIGNDFASKFAEQSALKQQEKRSVGKILGYVAGGIAGIAVLASPFAISALKRSGEKKVEQEAANAVTANPYSAYTEEIKRDIERHKAEQAKKDAHTQFASKADTELRSLISNPEVMKDLDKSEILSHLLSNPNASAPTIDSFLQKNPGLVKNNVLENYASRTESNADVFVSLLESHSKSSSEDEGNNLIKQFLLSTREEPQPELLKIFIKQKSAEIYNYSQGSYRKLLDEILLWSAQKSNLQTQWLEVRLKTLRQHCPNLFNEITPHQVITRIYSNYFNIGSVKMLLRNDESHQLNPFKNSKLIHSLLGLSSNSENNEKIKAIFLHYLSSANDTSDILAETLRAGSLNHEPGIKPWIFETVLKQKPTLASHYTEGCTLLESLSLSSHLHNSSDTKGIVAALRTHAPTLKNLPLTTSFLKHNMTVHIRVGDLERIIPPSNEELMAYKILHNINDNTTFLK